MLLYKQKFNTSKKYWHTAKIVLDRYETETVVFQAPGFISKAPPSGGKSRRL